MITRIAQLFARLIATVLMSLAVAAGVTEEQAAGLAAHADAIALALASLVASAVDLLIHRVGLGSVLAPAASVTAGKASDQLGANSPS